MAEEVCMSTDIARKRLHDEVEGPLSSQMTVGQLGETYLSKPTSPAALHFGAGSGRQLSPTISNGNSVLSDTTTTTSSALQVTAAIGPAPAKKQKLTFTEKEAVRLVEQSEREAKLRKQAEEAERKQQEKQRKEEEKQRKEEERKRREEERKRKEEERKRKEEERKRKEEEKEAARRQRDLEKADKLKVRDAERQAKEDAKRKKDEDMQKREGKQRRLGSFFQRPVAGEGLEESSRTFSRGSSVTSLGSFDDAEKGGPTKISGPKKSEAKHGFLPFFIPKHVSVAPTNRFAANDTNPTDTAVRRLDTWIEQEGHVQCEDLASILQFRKRKRYQMPRYTIKNIVEAIQGTSVSSVDSSAGGTFPQLSDIRYKILSFQEDVRPPYQGTYSRAVSPKCALKLSRQPCSRKLPDTNYDYDSEAEWEPPNPDDEDLQSGEDESDGGEEGDEDMDGFLDDEDDPGRRKQIVGEMTPISSGLCWANGRYDEKGPLEEYRIQTLSEQNIFPIDPFSSTYWPKPQQLSKQQSAMQPPRVPLSSLNLNRSLSMTPPSVNGEEELKSGNPSEKLDGPQETGPRASAKPLKLAPDEVLPAFKQAVQGSDLTKTGLIEVLKKQFPKLSKDTIRDTVGHVAVRHGEKEADKKWVLKDPGLRI